MVITSPPDLVDVLHTHLCFGPKPQNLREWYNHLSPEVSLAWSVLDVNLLPEPPPAAAPVPAWASFPRKNGWATEAEFLQEESGRSYSHLPSVTYHHPAATRMSKWARTDRPSQWGRGRFLACPCVCGKMSLRLVLICVVLCVIINSAWRPCTWNQRLSLHQRRKRQHYFPRIPLTHCHPLV